MRNTRWLFVTGAVALAALFVVAAGSQGNDKKPGTAPISVEMLREQPVIGDLGVPLGTVTEIRGTIVAGSTLRQKGYLSSYLLKVTHVGDKHVPGKTVPFEISLFCDDRAGLAASEDELRKLQPKNGRPDAETDIKTLEEGYVGKEFRLHAYEAGEFRGIPRNWPNAHYADVMFGFSNRLIVVSVGA